MKLRRTIMRTLLPILACGLCVPSFAETVSDEDVKLALVYKILRFVTWPESSSQSSAPFRLCLAEESIFRVAEDRFAGRQMQDREIEVRLLTDNATQIADKCDVFYMTRLNEERVTQVLEHIGGAPVLTVSDAPEFAEAGGMVGLSRQDKKVVISINVAAYASSGLIVSSQLLELAELVNDNRKARR